MRKRRYMLSGCIIKPKDFKNGFETIISNFASSRWLNILTVQEDYHPSLVFEFYANLKKLKADKDRKQ